MDIRKRPNADQVNWFKTVNDVQLLNIASSPPLDQPYKSVFRLSPFSAYVPSTAGNVLSSSDDGLDPDGLKYGWPGTITESVDKAVNGD